MRRDPLQQVARSPHHPTTPGEGWETRASERGVALPMALIALVVLATLSAVFVTLAGTEPSIASNHLRSTQARAMAESGLERALWALTHASVAGALAATGTPPYLVLTTSPASPYDGSTLTELGPSGGFFITVTGTEPNLRAVRSIGWSPATADARLAGKSELVTSVARLPNVPGETPCAVCIGAALTLTGATTIDARASEHTGCGAKVAAASAGDVTLEAGVRLAGSGAPADGAGLNVEGRDWRRTESVPRVPAVDLDTLRAQAAAFGTYVKPASSAPLDLADVRDGLVFVDTPAGTNAVTPGNRASIRIGPGFSARRPFRGWLVVLGDAVLEGLFGDIHGLVYAANAVGVSSDATGTLRGMLVAAHTLGSASATLGTLDVAFDCDAARGSGVLPSGWFVVPGRYCDQVSGC